MRVLEPIRNNLEKQKILARAKNGMRAQSSKLDCSSNSILPLSYRNCQEKCFLCYFVLSSIKRITSFAENFSAFGLELYTLFVDKEQNLKEKQMDYHPKTK